MIGFMCLFLCLFSNKGVAGQDFHPDIIKIRQNFKNFDYRSVIDSSNVLLRNTADLDTADILELHRLSAVAYFSTTRMDSALLGFIELLKIDPSYELDKRENSPRIIDFFNEIKRNYKSPASIAEGIRQEKTIDTVLVSPAVTNHFIAYSMLFPGAGHRLVGEKTKGWILSGLSVFSLGTAVYYTVEANKREKDYLNAIDKAEISARYDDYNQAYQIRNAAWVLFGAVWLYTQVDLLFFTDTSVQERRFELTISPPLTHTEPIMLSTRIHF